MNTYMHIQVHIRNFNISGQQWSSPNFCWLFVFVFPSGCVYLCSLFALYFCWMGSHHWFLFTRFFSSCQSWYLNLGGAYVLHHHLSHTHTHNETVLGIWIGLGAVLGGSHFFCVGWEPFIKGSTFRRGSLEFIDQ